MATQRPLEPSAELLSGAEASPRSPPSRAWVERLAPLKVWLIDNRVDLTCITALSALCLVVHLLEPEPLEMLGDAYEKWFFVRQWFHHPDLGHALWTHHMTRMGVNVLAFFAQLGFGRSWRAYYIAPMAMAVLQIPFVYLIAKRLSNRLGGFAAALLLVYFPTAARSASQLLPDGFAGTYIAVATYLFLRFVTAEARARTRWLLGCALFCLLGYEAKETALFFVPGFALAIALESKRGRERRRALLVYLAVILAGIALETVFYRIFTAYPHRLAVIERGPHATEGGIVASVWQLFDRYSNPNFEDCLKFLLAFFAASALGLLALARSRGARVLLLLPLSQLFFLTFCVRSWHPIRLWQIFDSRYVESATPLVIAVIGAFTALCLGAIGSEPSERVRRLLGFFARRPALSALAAALVLGLASYSAVYPNGGGGFRQNAVQAAILRDAYERNLPILTDNKPREVEAVYTFLLPDRLIARGDRLPPFAEAHSTSGDTTYLVRDPSVYSDNVLKNLRPARCMVTVSQSGRFLSIDPDIKLWASCDELLAQLTHKAAR